MKASELIKILDQATALSGDLEVKASWESITPEIHSIYIGNEKSGAPGVILLDSDGGFYQEDYADTVLWEDKDA